MNFPVFDLHCDALGALAGIDKKDPVHLRDNKCHIDLNRASSLPGYAQCFAIFTPPYMEDWHHVAPVTVFERDLDAFQREMALNCGTMVQAYTAQDVRDHQAKGLMSAILTIEGPAGFGFDPALLEDLYKAGFRITTLGWNEKNPLTGSHETGGGLTDLGIILGVEVFTMAFAFSVDELSTMSAILMAFIGLLVLYQVCKPFDWKRRIIWGTMAVATLVSVTGFGDSFGLTPLTVQSGLVLGVFLALSYPVMHALVWIFDRAEAVLNAGRRVRKRRR